MSSLKTFIGIHFDPCNPNIELIDIKDIAHSLSFLCRGNGHVHSFFSVAQHSICCAKEAQERGYSNRIVLACLLHDASEAYMADVPSPLKYNLKEYVEIENNLLNLIYLKYLGHPLSEEEKEIVAEIDRSLLKYDLKYLLKENIAVLPDVCIDISYDFVSFEEVETMFLNLFESLTQA